jgi:hypothetical protein
MPAFSQSGGHYNVVARDTMEPGRITMNNEGQVVGALELDISGGPLNITKVVIHFADRNLKPWSSPIAPPRGSQVDQPPHQVAQRQGAQSHSGRLLVHRQDR